MTPCTRAGRNTFVAPPVGYAGDALLAFIAILWDTRPSTVYIPTYSGNTMPCCSWHSGRTGTSRPGWISYLDLEFYHTSPTYPFAASATSPFVYDTPRGPICMQLARTPSTTSGSHLRIASPPPRTPLHVTHLAATSPPPPPDGGILAGVCAGGTCTWRLHGARLAFSRCNWTLCCPSCLWATPSIIRRSIVLLRAYFHYLPRPAHHLTLPTWTDRTLPVVPRLLHNDLPHLPTAACTPICDCTTLAPPPLPIYRSVLPRLPVAGVYTLGQETIGTAPRSKIR